MDGKRKVKLTLTDRGEQRLGSCGAKEVKVRGLYRAHGKKRKAVDIRNLKKDASRCEKPYTPVPVENADRCDFLDPPSACSRSRTTTSPRPTRPRYRPAARPERALDAGEHQRRPHRPDRLQPRRWLQPRQPDHAQDPAARHPAAFDKTGIVPVDDWHAYADANQPVVVINAETGERQPICAELDRRDRPSDAPGDDARRQPDHPAGEELRQGGHYIVALRNLGTRRTADRAADGFRVYRDD